VRSFEGDATPTLRKYTHVAGTRVQHRVLVVTLHSAYSSDFQYVIGPPLSTRLLNDSDQAVCQMVSFWPASGIKIYGSS